MGDSWDGERAPYVLERHTEDAPQWNSWDGAITRDNDSYKISGATARAKFREFFRNYRLGNVYYYREALLRNWNKGDYFVEVDIAHVHEFDDVLLNCLQVLITYYFVDEAIH
jgi:hypothetical protein